MRRLLFVFALFSPFAAFAQVTLILNGTGNTISIGTGDCGNQVSVNWTVLTTTTPCTDLTLFATESGSCNQTGPTGTDFTFATVPAALVVSTRNGSQTVDVNQFPGQSGADGGFTCGEATTKTWKICGWYDAPGYVGFTYSCGSSNQHVIGTGTVNYDGEPPAAPSINSVEPIGNGLKVTVTFPSDAITLRFGTRVSGTSDDFVFGSDVAVTSDTQATDRVEGLQNGRTYDVEAEALDAAGNVSAASNVVQGTPQPTEGFWAAYKAAGGKESGGCGAVGGESMMFLSGLLLVFSRRKQP